MTEVTGALRRLEALNVKCGGAARQAPAPKDGNGDEEVDLSQMSAYERAQYKMACRVKRTRDNMVALEGVQSSSNVTRRIELSNAIRKEIVALKRDGAQLQSVAANENKREEYNQLMAHVRKTEQQFRARLNGSGGVESESVRNEREGIVSPGFSGASTFRDEEMSRLGEPMISLHDDDEFVQFFEQTKHHDLEIDQALDRIGAGLTRLQDNAVVIQSELQVQDRLLDDTERKVEGVTDELKTVNRRLKKTLKALDKDRMGIYIFCCVLLISIMGVLYFMIKL